MSNEGRMFIIGIAVAVGLGAALYAGNHVYQNWDEIYTPPEAVEEVAGEEITDGTRTQFTAPMRRWLEAGNRLAVDFVYEDGWCAVAISRPVPEDAPEGETPTIQCIK